MVKVLVGGSWRLVWVERIADLDRDYLPASYLPFETFAFYSWGTQQDKDLDWPQTQRSLLEAGNAESHRLTDEELRVVYGSKTFDRYAKPASGKPEGAGGRAEGPTVLWPGPQGPEGIDSLDQAQRAESGQGPKLR